MDELRFKSFLVARGIKQSEIADLLDLDISNVNAKINGKQDFTLEQIRTICKHYGIAADEYFI